MKKKELAKLRENVMAYNKRVVLNGSKLTKYECQHCKKKVDTLVPERNEVGIRGYWDSATICIECGKMNFLVTYPTGKTITRAMGR